MYPSHLKLKHRKALSSLLTIYESIGPLEFQFYTEKKQYLVKGLLNDIELILNSLQPNTKDSEYLSIFSHSVISEFLGRSEKMLEGLPPHLSVELIHRIKKNLAKIDCNQCNDGPCDGSPLDDQKVHTHGSCIGTIREMFHFALEVAHEYYSKYTYYNTHIKSNKPHIFLSTVPFSRKPHKLPVEFNVSGKTIFYTKDANESSEIQLQIWPENYKFQCYLSTLYIFFHECICHAFQNLIHHHNERQAPESKDYFSEGWMDWISFSILEKVFKGKGIKIKQHPNFSFSESSIDWARKFHEARIDYRNEKGSDHALRRALGAKTAKKFYYFFVNAIELGDQKGWDTFLGISFNLNLFFHEYFEMQEFVNKLHAILPEPPKSVPIPDKAVAYYKLKKITYNYLASRNAEKFFGDVISNDLEIINNYKRE